MRVQFGDFRFDSGMHELRRGDAPCRLSGKAFALLEALIERRPNVLTQKELYDLLWPNTFVEMANLHNLISEVRAALGDRDHQIVKTVYGIGFSFAANAVESAADKVESAARAAMPAVSGWSLVVGDEQFLLPQGESLVGRGSELTVHVPRPTISRHHARLTVTTTGVSLEDLASKNGTFVNEERIAESVPVGTGDAIRFGKVRARLVKDDYTVSESGITGRVEDS